MAITHSEVDETFAGVYQTLFGDAIDVREAYEISKFAPQGSDVSTHRDPKKEKKLAQVGLAGTGMAGVAGTHGLYLSTKKYGKDLKPSNFKKPVAPKTGQLALDGMEHLGKPAAAVSPKKAAAIGAGFIGLHAAELGADALGARALNRQRKDANAKIKKSSDEALADIIKAYKLGNITKAQATDLAVKLVEYEEISKWTPPGIVRGAKNALTTTSVFAKAPTARAASAVKRAKRISPLVRANERANLAEQSITEIPKARSVALRSTAVVTAATAGTVGYKQGKKKGIQAQFAKNDEKVDYGFYGEISKVDDDKRTVFGWCSLSEMDGQPVVDLQDDYAPIDEIEKSAYAYVVSSRVGGDMHTREGEKARHTSDLIESFIATPEKLQQMGLTEEIAKSVPVGWWVGFKVNDEEQWQMVKDGRRAGFSIHGKGARVSKMLHD